MGANSQHAGRWIPAVAAAAVLALGACVLEGLTRGGRNGAVNEEPGAASEPAGRGEAPADLGGWRTVPQGRDLLVKAEDVRRLVGKMELGEGPDNADVLGPGGERATVHFVWVRDKACAEGEDPGLHMAEFELRVEQAGTYYPWARVWWTDSCGNSIVVLLQGEGQERPLRWEVTDDTARWWHWLPLAGSDGVALEPGVYRVTVQNREDGARLSRILFTRRSYGSYKPATPEG